MKNYKGLLMAGIMVAALMIGVCPIPSVYASSGSVFDDKYDAASFDQSSGSVRAESGLSNDLGTALTCVSNGDWVLYKGIDFGDGASRLSVNLAGFSNATAMTVVLDNLEGTPVGVVKGANTGGIQNYLTVDCSLTGVKGIHNLYFILNEGFNICWFQFSK